MVPVYAKSKVCENIEISKGIYRLSINGEFNAVPGQFYMLRAWGIEPILSRPVSVHDVDKDKIYFLYEVRGRGTEILSRLSTGDNVEFLGPLGKGFDMDLQGKIAVVTGGIGIAPLLYTAKKLKVAEIDLYAGFKDDAYLLDSFSHYVDKIHVSTDSGKEGHKGFVTEIFNPKGYDAVLCCGPEIMMKRVAKMCAENDVKVFVSMEGHMACGIGACLVCTCKTNEGNKRTCKDGPVFSGEDVIWDA